MWRLHPGDGESQLGIWGEVASGKTHLLNATAEFARRQGIRLQIYDGGQLRLCDAEAFDGYHDCELLVIDNLDRLAGDPSWEACFCQVINRCRAGEYRFLYSMSEKPTDLVTRLADFRSRLQWGLMLQLPSVDDAEIRRILQKRAGLLGFELSNEVVSYLMTRRARNLSEQIGLLHRLDGISLSQQRRVTIPLVRQVLSEQAD